MQQMFSLTTWAVNVFNSIMLRNQLLPFGHLKQIEFYLFLQILRIKLQLPLVLDLKCAEVVVSAAPSPWITSCLFA